VTENGSASDPTGSDATHDSAKDDPYTDGSVPADADLASDDEETKGAAPTD
jgi:hypothetical protein